MAAQPTPRQQHLHAVALTAPSGTDANEISRLLELYFRDVPTDALIAQSPATLFEIVTAHVAAAGTRPAGVSRICTREVSSEADGFTAVDIVTDDLPYLVESLTSALTAHSLGLRSIVHPQVTVLRAPDGALVEIHDPRSCPAPPGAHLESWIHLEIDGLGSDGARTELATHLRDVLDDVRAVVEDRTSMEVRARTISASLDHGVPGIGAYEIDEARRLLAWVADGGFTLMGHREYTLERAGHAHSDGTLVLRPVPGTGMGLLRDTDAGRGHVLPPAAAARAEEPRLLVVTSTNARATVRANRRLDYIGIKTFDQDGHVVGEQRFIGLFPDSPAAEFTDVAYLATKVGQVEARSGFVPGSHLANELLRVLQELPRQEILQSSLERLTDLAVHLVHLRERPRIRVFIRPDVYGRFVSCLVMLPRAHFDADAVATVERTLSEALGGQGVETSTRLTDDRLAQLHVLVQIAPDTPLPTANLDMLEQSLDHLTRPWDQSLRIAAEGLHGPQSARRFLSAHARRFTADYRASVSPEQAAADLALLDSILQGAPAAISLEHTSGGTPSTHDLRIALHRRLTISDLLQMLQHLGAEPVNEQSHDLSGDEVQLYLHVVGLREPAATLATDADRQRTVACIRAVLDGVADSDPLNGLVLTAGLTWHEVAVLRSLGAYLRQTGTSYSRAYVEETLVSNPAAARALVLYFEARFLPHVDGDRAELQDGARAALLAAFDDVASLDHDRILRDLTQVVAAIVRTNAFHDGAGSATVTFKLRPDQIPWLPRPIPVHELFVHSPRVEGVHLRFGEVARGGLRWSDRKEDYRTEVLGLAKAQAVKNAVIVPAGAKGGFVAKHLPDPAVDRDAWFAAGAAAYREFVSGMLSVTDNLLDGHVVPPDATVRHDGDDPYLVVAADKGTASFSDTANAVSAEHGFWLDDAFASGGSAGYDHKAMGITARGAWESVRRHFRELGHDTQTQNFTVAGIGDMSGDVFGNGMLLSEHIRLVAAFDHRHIFLDPDPDAVTSYAERRRLFHLPRSSWADYDRRLISSGGGVYPRTAKSVPISDQARHALGLPEGTTELTPTELVSAVLRAPVDLLWNGGIGTYVKATTESHSDVGDRTNDAVRVDAAQLRCRVVGEGGNLGLTQRARIEAALAGVHLNTDAIDNSAGVDSSDHEVNIKILLAAATADGRLSRAERDELLASMTDDVAQRVLRHNYEQNVLLGNARSQQHHMLGAHQRFMRWLENNDILDRELEALPDDTELERRAAAGIGLSSPEFAILVAYAKIALERELLASALPDDPWFARELVAYFPSALHHKFADELRAHPLRREIIANRVANQVVDRGGITFVFRAMEETGASAEQVVRAFVICREVFGLADYVDAVEKLDGTIQTAVQSTLYLGFRRLLARGVRWFMQHRPATLDIDTETARYLPAACELSPLVAGMLRADENDAARARADELARAGVPRGLADRASALAAEHALLDITEVVAHTDNLLHDVAAVRYAVAPVLGVDRLQALAADLPRETRWDSLARSALRQELQTVLDDITAQVLGETTPGSADDRLSTWIRPREGAILRIHHALADLGSDAPPHTAPLLAVLQMIRLTIDRPHLELEAVNQDEPARA